MTDPYFDTQVCVDRLYGEYQLHKKLIVAVDFDDTVYDFHQVGHWYPEVIDLLKRCQDKGFYIVLFTGSDPSKWYNHFEYLAVVGIIIHGTNENPIPLPFGNHGKMYYNILL